ncbi:MAG: conjugal transfer protein TraF [Woeseiaceae bacterium]
MAIVILCCGTAIANASTTYGVFDARTMAMGGVAVASANNDNAQFYNSALLAFNDEIEERTEDSRIWFPMLSPQIARAVIDAENIYSDDLHNALTRSVVAFNGAQDQTTARDVANSSADLRGALQSIADRELFVDVYAGISLTEPGKFVGAGFFLGGRVLVSGMATITSADLDLLNAYEEGLLFVASNGAEGRARPELFDASGALIDPQGNYDSSVAAAGVTIIEVGVASAHQVEFLGQKIAAGWTFKAINVRTFEDVQRLDNERVDLNRREERDSAINFDLGAVKDFGNGWRVGVAIKDIIPHDYETTAGTRLKLRPRPRVGVSYQRGDWQFGADADLVTSQPLAGIKGVHEVAVGAEWVAKPWLRVRSGYRHDINGSRRGAVSVGVGTLWKRLAADIAFLNGSRSRGMSLQFGMAF